MPQYNERLSFKSDDDFVSDIDYSEARNGFFMLTVS